MLGKGDSVLETSAVATKNFVRTYAIIFILSLVVIAGLVVAGYLTADGLVASIAASLEQAQSGEQKQSLAGEMDTLRIAVAIIAGGILAALAVIALAIFVPLLKKLSRQTQELIDLARTDPLTGCHNRRSFLTLGEAELERYRRYDADLSVIMLDIDRFKSVNDTYGHAVGDEVIRALARCCLENLRRPDVLGRMGGEEFAIILPETSIENAMLVAEKIRAALSETPVAHPGGVLNFTASLGVASADPEDPDILSTINRADNNLYAAKAAGRNRVIGPTGTEASGGEPQAAAAP